MLLYIYNFSGVQTCQEKTIENKFSELCLFFNIADIAHFVGLLMVEVVCPGLGL